MVSTTLDDEKERDARAVLAQGIDRQITYALHVLGESGVEETGPAKHRLRHRGAREETIKQVRPISASHGKMAIPRPGKKTRCFSLSHAEALL